MPCVRGTKTEKNVLAAFAGESQARNRYTYFAKAAKKEGFEQISAIFLETADNEMEHAKRFFSYLEGGMVEVKATFPAGAVGSTLENLRAAADGEKEEHTKLYPEAAKVADGEGFPEISALFRNVASVEVEHEKRYRALISNIEKGQVFERKGAVFWKCRNCGYITQAPKAPSICPACRHPQAHFELHVPNY
ncbi:MAG: rubrerythrin family protein [Thermoplasmata archaeon]|nr:rubrerythrin family protein [Thermoplasmata archaeon]